jgi:hypothetical protein
MPIFSAACIMAAVVFLVFGPPAAATLPARTSASRNYSVAYHLWEAGVQGDAEMVLASSETEYPYDRRITFFYALCVRSRFYIDESRPFFQQLITNDPETLE